MFAPPPPVREPRASPEREHSRARAAANGQRWPARCCATPTGVGALPRCGGPECEGMRPDCRAPRRERKAPSAQAKPRRPAASDCPSQAPVQSFAQKTNTSLGPRRTPAFTRWQPVAGCRRSSATIRRVAPGTPPWHGAAGSNRTNREEVLRWVVFGPGGRAHPPPAPWLRDYPRLQAWDPGPVPDYRRIICDHRRYIHLSPPPPPPTYVVDRGGKHKDHTAASIAPNRRHSAANRCQYTNPPPPPPLSSEQIKSEKNTVRTGVFVGHAVR